MKKIYVSGNYIIIERDGGVYEYPMKNTVYIFDNANSAYKIEEQNGGGSTTITEAELNAGDWEDDAASVYSVATFKDFIRNNSANFKTASGSSGAIGAEVLKTGQSVSYRTGDDGDLQEGRKDDFYMLEANNPFGNLNRFTGITGGYYDQTLAGWYDKDGVSTTELLAFPEDIVLDWGTFNGSTCLGYYRIQNPSGVNWESHIDTALTHSTTSFSSGFYLANRKEIENIMNLARPTANAFSYEPFAFTYQMFSSTTYIGGTAQAWYFTLTGVCLTTSKTAQTSLGGVFCRKFTVNGTTIT